MIISKTPNRISFLGGGTDFENFIDKYGGATILSTSIDKYSYITYKELPPFHKHKSSYLATFNGEIVDSNEKFRHKALNQILKYYNIKDGIEISYHSDLPKCTGTGSSSAFVVGLASIFEKNTLDKKNLAHTAIHLEQKVLNENVGYQDQIACSCGDFNIIEFYKDGDFSVDKISKKHVDAIAPYCMLFYTKLERISSKIIETYDEDISKRFPLCVLCGKGITKLLNNDIEGFGKAVNESFKIKCSLSPSVMTPTLNAIYLTGILHGAFGGKITGSGGGGSILFIIPPEKQESLKSELEKMGCVHVPFNFENEGNKVIKI